ncbi:MAG: hypothetical protein RL136_674 [Planctomycetota bacterium]|jgi:hypothetical protein
MMQRTIPIAILSLSGVILILAYFSPLTTSWGETVLNWFNVLAAVAFVLGAGNILRVNLEKISSQRPGWAYAAITLVSFFAMLAFGLFKIGAVPNAKYPDIHFAGDYETTASPYGWMYEYVLSPLTATMFALLAFYVASAAFRAFRAKNTESILLLGTAFIILIAQTAAGMFLTAWIPDDSAFAFLRFDSMRAAITQHIQTAGMRAITIGIALGVVATSLRLILGIDKSYLSSR